MTLPVGWGALACRPWHPGGERSPETPASVAWAHRSAVPRPPRRQLTRRAPTSPRLGRAVAHVIGATWGTVLGPSGFTVPAQGGPLGNHFLTSRSRHVSSP